MTRAIAIHEAAHCVAAYVLGLGLRSVSIRPRDGHGGLSRFDLGVQESPIAVAVVLSAGRMAERIFEGSPQRVNWLADDHDVTAALELLADMPDPLLARRIVELRTRSLLSVRWRVVQALANELGRRAFLLGPQIEQFLVGQKVSRAGEGPPSIDPDAIHATINGQVVRDKRGRPLTLRQWSDTMAGRGFDKRRALALVAGVEGED